VCCKIIYFKIYFIFFAEKSDLLEGYPTMNTNNMSDNGFPNEEDSCPDYSDESDLLLDELSFYLEGILQTFLASVGLLSNIVACLVLASKQMRNSFNLVSNFCLFNKSLDRKIGPWFCHKITRLS